MKHKFKCFALILVAVVLIKPTVIASWHVMTQIYFWAHYDPDEYAITDRLYYDAKNDSDLSLILSWINFEFPGIVYRIKSKTSPDSDFHLGCHNWRIRDSYSIYVEGRRNTKERFEREFYLLVEELNIQLKDVNDYYIYLYYDGEDIRNILHIDMDFDRSVPLQKICRIYTSIRKNEEEKLISAIKEWDKVFIENDLFFEAYSISLPYEGGPSYEYNFAAADVRNEYLMKILIEQDNQNQWMR